ncbi:MAG TPA: SDR family oxidoreductase [Myxococcota bacterium]|nr:SDR family oxidoreductase [Myxococcales bacterium]HPG25481.1 SDR family oxidoreductase [Myxococcota bacterium]
MSVRAPDLSGKVAVVTGGSKGLGLAMARAFAEAGADLVVASRKLEACEAAAAEIRDRTGRRCEAIACHVGDWDACGALVDATVERFGRIDVLVNNAGIAPVAPSLREVSEALFDKTIGVNLKGPLRLSALAAEHMREGSTILNISSVASVRPIPFTAVYACAKAGLNTLTKVMAQEFAPRGIRVNGIVCGTFWTDSFRASVPNQAAADAVAEGNVLGRVAEPEEIVGTALYLATDASSYTTGQLIQVDGGVLP